MGDIHCRVCGEPWDAYGIRHHEDMTEREANAFRLGLGCPCCEGETEGDEPDQMDFLSTLTDPINEDGDPIETMHRAMVGDVLKQRGLTWKRYVEGVNNA